MHRVEGRIAQHWNLKWQMLFPCILPSWCNLLYGINRGSHDRVPYYSNTTPLKIRISSLDFSQSFLIIMNEKQNSLFYSHLVTILLLPISWRKWQVFSFQLVSRVQSVKTSTGSSIPPVGPVFGLFGPRERRSLQSIRAVDTGVFPLGLKLPVLHSGCNPGN